MSLCIFDFGMNSVLMRIMSILVCIYYFSNLLVISNQRLKLPNLFLDFDVNFILLHASINSQYFTIEVHYRSQFYDKSNNVAYDGEFVLFVNFFMVNGALEKLT